ncbi:MAG: hypothetical protein C6Y22_17865 [Hapalosiphonaceae cyanobacterium JJU2]|nr:MAG: hypothetical protein C6Y22_17865 [Hapalosiphonaceae cyanobacterium JJU2]
MQLLDLENKELLREISTEEFANVSGGGIQTAAAYNTVASTTIAGLAPGVPGSAANAVRDNTTFLFAINAQTAPGSAVSP